MTKKIKREKIQTEAEKKAEEATAAEAATRAASGIQDEFQARGFELVEWVHDKQGIVLGLLGAIVAGGLAIGVYTTMKHSRNADSSAALAEAFKVWEAPVVADGETAPDKGPSFKDAGARTTAAKAAFDKVAQSHDGTGAGAVAQLYLGHAALRSVDAPAAIKAYQAFLDATAADDALRFAGYSGLAAAKEAAGDIKGAIVALEALVNLGDKTDEDSALLELGRLYKADGNPAQARRSLERIAKDFPESSLKSRADGQLATLPAAATAPTPAAPSGPPAVPAP